METKEERIGFVIIPPTVLGDRRLAQGAKLVYGRIFGFIERYGYCNGSNEYLSQHIGMTKNTFKGHLKRLYELDYLRYDLIRDGKGEVKERRIYPTLGSNSTLPLGSHAVPPRVKYHPKERKHKKENNVKEKNEIAIGYYAEVLADKLNDRKSLSFYKLACRRYDPHLLLRQAAEIIGDGGARNPAAVFVAWLKTKEPGD